MDRNGPLTGTAWNLKDESGKTSGFSVPVKILPERKKAEDGLKASEEKYSTLIEQSTDGILILVNRMTRFANRKMCEMSGYAPDEIWANILTTGRA